MSRKSEKPTTKPVAGQKTIKRYSIAIQAPTKQDTKIASLMVDIIMEKNLIALGMTISRSIAGAKVITGS